MYVGMCVCVSVCLFVDMCECACVDTATITWFLPPDALLSISSLREIKVTENNGWDSCQRMNTLNWE